MSTTVSDELLRKFGPAEDPVSEARRQKILRALLETSPNVREEFIQKGREEGLFEARAALRGVLGRRQLTLTPDQESRIEQCADFAVLRRWMIQAVTASTAAEALQ